MSVCASDQAWVWCVYVYLSSSTKSPVDSYLSVYVMEALLDMLKRGEPRLPRCTCVCARKIKGECGRVHVYESVCHLHSTADSYLCVYVCSYMYVNIAERLWLHKAVILLLIIKYFVLKIVSCFHTSTLCNIFNKRSAKRPTQRKSPTGYSH